MATSLDPDARAPQRDVAGVVAPPPLIFGVALVAGLVLGRNGVVGRNVTCARVSGALAIVAGALVGGATLRALATAGTPARPDRPSSALVTTGPFLYTRNPAYIGATAIYIGVALAARSLPALTFLPIALIVLERGVIEREERYLDGRFGEAYRAYCRAVPRWF
jgi:protein-S-isoprenylcysteine O-methyltransferase Ste14